MGGLRRARLRGIYLRWIAAASAVTLLIGLGIFTVFAGGHTSWAPPWVLFGVCIGTASLVTVWLPAGGAGPLARLVLALAFFVAQLFVLTGGAGADLDNLGNRAGPLGQLWDDLGAWLGAYSLGLFDSVGWRLNLIFGLLLLAVYPFVRLLVAPILSMVGKHAGSMILDMRGIDTRRRNAEIRGNEVFFANLPARHMMLFLAVMSIAFVILLPPVTLALDHSRMFGAASMIEAGERMIWTGSLILLLELTALTLYDAPRAAKPALSGEPADVRTPARLDQLYWRLREVAGKFVIYSYPQSATDRRSSGAREPASKPKAVPARRRDGPSALVVDGLARLSDLVPGTLDQLRGQLDEFLAPDVAATRMAIAEALTATHYLLFAQLVSHTLDNGGTVVVVAPDELISDVKANFQLALLKSGLSFAAMIYRANVNPPSEHELFNLVLVPASLFETGFLRYSDSYESVLTRLSMIFLLEAADMDLGWLRLRLFSLWQLTSHDRTRIVVQSSTSRRLNEIVGMVATQGGKIELTAASLTPSAKKATHVLVFDGTAEFRDHLSAQVFPGVRETVSAALSLTFESARFSCEPIVHKKSLDPAEAAQVESDWFRKAADLGQQDRSISAIENGEAALAAVSSDRFRSHLRPADAPATVIVWDTYNLLSVREHNYNFSGELSFLVQILSKNYPMRQFLHEVEDSPSGTDHFRMRELFRRRVPRLAGGIAELTYATIHGMRRSQGLSRTEYRLILDTIPEGKLVESAGIGNDRSGIDRLLQLHEIQSRVSVREDVDPLTGERLFRVQTTGGPLDFFDPVRVTQAGVALPGNPLDYSDRGLTFGMGTNVRVGDRIWRVSGISNREIRLADHPGGALVDYVFVNRYLFRLEIAPIIEYRSADQREHTYVGTAILHVSYQRQTEEICDFPTGVEPFSRAATLNRRLTRGDGWAVVDRNRQCVAHIVLNGVTGSLPQGQRVGEPLVPQFGKAAVALGVCTIIKDTIASLFPDLAARVAVLSPQLSGIDQQLETLANEPGTDVGIRDDARLALFLADRVGHVDRFDPAIFDAWAQPELREKMADRDDILEILIVEDSDRDLGVARALAQPDGDVLRAAALFAADLEQDEQPESAGSYLRFGAPKLSRFIYVPGAANLLRKLGRLPELEN